MWTHTVLLLELVEGNVHTVVEYTDGTNTFQRHYTTSTGTDLWLKQQITTALTQLEANTAFVGKFTPGPVDLTPVVIPPPTAFELAKTEYFKQVAILAQLKQALKPDDAAIVAQEALVKSLYQAAFYTTAPAVTVVKK
jgi:hypothetical protein